ncbi:MAG: hypothetical protein IMZ44_02010 [Planctomycetes bacterium]|nr:hypothetical protein [Planctomycetota bacterium]
MSLLLRKIEKAKWLQIDILHDEDVSADAITNCLKTSMNRLSVWEVVDETRVSDGVVAMASQGDHLETIDVVLLCQGELGKVGLEVERSSDIMAPEKIADKHRDVVGLTYRKLGELARLIVDGIRANKMQRYTEGKLRRLLQEAVTRGDINRADLSEGVRRKLC